MFAKGLVAGLMVLLMASWASAVVVDGTNDFPPGSLIDPDGGDTQFSPIDIGDVHVTYDATGVYIGYGQDHDGWGGIQIGIAIVTGAPGGTFDPWCHKIGFQGVCHPKYIAYVDVDSRWTEWGVWDVGLNDWVRTPNILAWEVGTPFDEIALPYSLLGIDCTVFSQVFFEIWVTQNSCTKGPLDLSFNDALQLSTPGGTIWDIDQPVMISCYWCLDLMSPSATEQTTWGNIKALYR
jgi:hypothetical protein